MSGAQATYDVISSEAVGVATDVMCDGLEQLMTEQRIREQLLLSSASEYLQLPREDPRVTELATATAVGLAGTSRETQRIRNGCTS
jgi:hypothetical protein